MAGKAKSGTVFVRAVKGNMDMMNEGEQAVVDNDDRVKSLIAAGYLIELNDDGTPKDADAAGSHIVTTAPSRAPAVTESRAASDVVVEDGPGNGAAPVRGR